MSEMLPTAAPQSLTTTSRVEKRAPEKAENDANPETAEREFAEVLEDATGASPPAAAISDPAAAIAAAGALANVVATSAREPGANGDEPVALPAAASPPTVRILRPEARIALASAPPETAPTTRRESVPEADGVPPPAAARDETGRFDAPPTGGKVLEIATAEPGARVGDSEPARPAPTANGAPAAHVVAADAGARDRAPPLRLDTQLPVHAPRFGEGFGQQIVVLAQHGVHHAQLSLTPPELGPVDVRITAARDEVSVQIAAASGVARDAIQEALPRLREMMEQSGVRLQNAGVFTQLPQREPQTGAQPRPEWWQGPGAHPELLEDPSSLPSPPRLLGLIDAYA